MTQLPAVLALDVGGANLKASDGDRYCASQPFALWKNPTGLADALRTFLTDAPQTAHWAVTMTGELCDCFATKRDGVTAIIDAVVAAAPAEVVVRIYLTDGSLVVPEEAKQRHREAASSNWHAMGAFVAKRIAPRAGVLVDVGSTTTDIIPLVGGRPVAVGRTDVDRLAIGELVYTGVVRSPICAVTPTLPYRGRVCGTAQELFATAHDAYLMLRMLPEHGEDCNTADGRPATREFARARLARCICADGETFDEHDAMTASAVVKLAQARRIADAFSRATPSMIESPQVVVVGGQGEFLAREALAHVGWAGKITSLAEEFGPSASRVGPAFALAQIAREARWS